MKYVLAMLVGLAIFFAGFFLGKYHSFNKRDEKLQLINPTLQLESFNLPHLGQSAVQESVEKIISTFLAGRDVSAVGFYFRDLRGGPTFGINENMSFIPASLLKVPVMIDYFKRLPADPELLSKLIIYDPSKHDIRRVSPLLEDSDPLAAGHAYSVQDLLTRMITLSDNTAANMLLGAAGVNIGMTLQNMGVALTEREGQVWLSVKDYASIFRILYNGQYLTPDNSSRALELLTQCKYREGLPKLLPDGTTIAHKFGERTLGDVSQFHDCGIVYHPNRPYLICVMSRGHKMSALIDAVAQISKVVYDQVNEGGG